MLIRKAQIYKILDKIDFASIKKYAADLKTYINTEVRQGQFLDNPDISTQKFIEYISSRMSVDAQKLKSEAGKLKRQEQINSTNKELATIKKSIKLVFEITKIVATLKNNLVRIFNEMTKNSYLGTYFEQSTGVWKTSDPEGFAVSKTEGGPDITKFVKRQEFSAQNFAK